jgi:hypothetical protein
MSDSNVSRPSTSSPLTFDNSVSVPPADKTCARCGKALVGSYHMMNAEMICGGCRAHVQRMMNDGSGFGRVGRAFLFGLGAAIVGGGIWYAIQESTGWQIGLIAVLVGWMIGKAVNRGSNGKGGWKYQAMAIVLTYFAVAATYVPMALKELRGGAESALTEASAQAAAGTEGTAGDPSAGLEEAPAHQGDEPVSAAETPEAQAAAAAGDVEGDETETPPSAAAVGAITVVALVAFVAALPIIVAFGSPISALILGFGLFEAWKQNRRTNVELSGPYSLGAPGSAAPAA